MKVTNMFKKLFAGLGLATLLLAGSVHGETTNLTIAAGVYTNVFVGPGKVTQFILSPQTVNTAASIKVYDASQTTSQVFTNPAYISAGYYATNYVTNWVNFFGVANSSTTLALIDFTNTVAATTNSFPVRLVMTASTNGQTVIDGVNYYFNSGLCITNTTGVGLLNVSITYQK